MSLLLAIFRKKSKPFTPIQMIQRLAKIVIALYFKRYRTKRMTYSTRSAKIESTTESARSGSFGS